MNTVSPQLTITSGTGLSITKQYSHKTRHHMAALLNIRNPDSPGCYRKPRIARCEAVHKPSQAILAWSFSAPSLSKVRDCFQPSSPYLHLCPLGHSAPCFEGQQAPKYAMGYPTHPYHPVLPRFLPRQCQSRVFRLETRATGLN